MEVQLRSFLTSALVEVMWSGSRSGQFILGKKNPGTHWTGGFVSRRVGLNVLKIELLNIN